jgi:chitinase
LPAINFLKLKAGSKLINAGTKDTGLPYNDDAPDLGPWEYDSQNPTVEIISPSSGNKFNAQETITIIANASDTDGFVSKVEFFNGTIKLGEDTLTPWSFTWNNVPVGNYSLTAVATDNLNKKTTSSPVNVEVRSDIINLYPNPNNGSFTLVLIEPLQRKGEITISSFEGKVIYKGTMLQGELTKSFNLQYIKDGYYIFALFGNEIILSRIFEKE